MAPLADTSLELEINQGISGPFVVLYDSVLGNNPGGANEYFAWFFMMDKATPDVDVVTPGDQAFGDSQVEATFIGSDGYHHAPGPENYATPGATDDIYYVHLGANFTLATPGMTYSTDTITVEMYSL